MLVIASYTFTQITDRLRAAYPNEGAGLLLGAADGAPANVRKIASAMLPLPNGSEEGEQYHRYLITARDMLDGEAEAERLGMDVVGVYHSHPDHPSQPSEFDREHALPWYSYLIVCIQNAVPSDSRAWVLSDDRSQFIEEEFKIETRL